MSETTPPGHAESTTRDTADGARGPSDAATRASEAADVGAGRAEDGVDAAGSDADTGRGSAGTPASTEGAAPGAAGSAEGPASVGGDPTGGTPPPPGAGSTEAPPPGGTAPPPPPPAGGGPGSATPPPPPGSPPPWGWGQRGGEASGGSIRQLRRSRTDRKLAGVCGGLGAYMNVDPIIFRVLFAVFSLFGGFGLLLYGIAWLFIPEEDDERSEAQHLFRDGHTSAGALWAIAATVVGLLIFVALAANEWDVVFWLLIGSAITFILLRSRNPQPSQVGPWWTAPPPPAAGPPAPPSSPAAAPGATPPPGTAAPTGTTGGTAGPEGTASPPATEPATAAGPAPPAPTALGYGAQPAQDPYTPQGLHTQVPYSTQPSADAGYPTPSGQWAVQQATQQDTQPQWQAQAQPQWPLQAQSQWQPQPPPPPAKPRESSPLPWLTLSAALVVGGILGALDLADVIDVSAEVIAATILIIFGVGLVVSAWFGRARSLIGLGIAALVALVVITAVDVPLSGGIGERHVEPVSAAELGDPVRVAAGKITIDLTRFNNPGATGVLDASVGAGQIVVIYPNDIRLEATADVSAGDVNRDLAEDIRVNDKSVVHEPVGASKGTVRLNLDVGAGMIRFEEAARATP